VSTHALSALVATIVGCAIGASVFLRVPRRSAHIIFATFTFNVALYYLFVFLSYGLDSEFFDWARMLIAVSLPSTAQLFFRAFLGDAADRPPLSRTTVVGAVVFYLGLCASRFIEPFHRLGWFRSAFFFYVFAGLYLSVFYLYQRYRSTPSRVEKIRLRYLLAGGVASVTAALIESWLGVFALGTVVVIVYLYFLSQTMARYRLLDLNEVLGRMLVLGALVALVTLVFSGMVIWVGPHQRGLFVFNAVVASTAILILFDPVRSRVEAVINKWMFQEKYELSRRIENLRAELLNIIDPRDITPRILASLEDSRRVTHASLYFVDPDGSGYELGGHMGPRPEGRLDAVTHRSFIARLRDQGVLTVEGLEQARATLKRKNSEEAEPLLFIMETLEAMNASVALAIVGDEQLLGIIGLKDERLREAYSSQELELLRGVALSVGVTLQNSQVYERMKERERLAALGQMAAGLAHEIRNPLGSIKGAAQYLRPADAPAQRPGNEAAERNAKQLTDKIDRDPSTGEFLDIIVEEVNRLNKIVSQFLDYARPYRGDQAPLDVGDLVRKTLALLKTEEAAAHVSITCNLPEVPDVRVDAEQIRQVILNLMMNAIQAMDGRGKIHISVGLKESTLRGAAVAFLEVRVRDTGPGIPERDIKNLFIPFFTTKEKGTGLGLPISQRIVENHGGTIEVRSRVNEGSVFTVLLPVEADAYASYREKHKGPPPIPAEETPETPASSETRASSGEGRHNAANLKGGP